MIRAYLFALDPTEGQAEVMQSPCGAARVAYNRCLARVRANWAQRAAEESYGIPEHERTPWIDTSAYSLRKAWNAAKHEVAPWWADNSKEAYATGCANLATALGNRKAGRARLPRFKSRRRARLTCRFTTGSIGLVRDRRHVQLPVIGVVRTDRRTRQEPSNRWRKARARADRLHTRVANLRRDDTHQLTSRLVAEHDVIVIEDLHVAGMLRNRRLARHIAGAAWAEIRRQLTYKTERAGARLVVADRWFASSKTCSGCGTAKAKLPLSERTFVCLACGIVLDRDENAARNLAALVAQDEHDTGELRREQPDGTDVRRARLAAGAVGSPRAEPLAQPHRREMVSR